MSTTKPLDVQKSGDMVYWLGQNIQNLQDAIRETGKLFWGFFGWLICNFSLLIWLGPMGGTALKRRKQERLAITFESTQILLQQMGRGTAGASALPWPHRKICDCRQSPIRFSGVQSSTWLIRRGVQSNVRRGASSSWRSAWEETKFLYVSVRNGRCSHR